MHVCINYHLAEPTSILPPSPCAQNWGTEALRFWENKMLLHSFGSFAEHNGQANLISSPCHDILKGRDNRQHESYNINSFSLFPISSLTSLLLSPTLSTTTTFSCCTNYRSLHPTSAWWNRALETQQKGEEILLVLNQTTSSILPLSHLSPFSPTLTCLPQSLGHNGLSRVLYLMTCESN